MQHDRPYAGTFQLLRWRSARAVCALITFLMLAAPTGEAVAAMLFPSGEPVHSVLALDRIWPTGQVVLSHERETTAGSKFQSPFVSALVQDPTRFSFGVSEGPPNGGIEGMNDSIVGGEANRPVQPIAPLPSTIFLFGPGVVGILGMLLRQDPRLKAAPATGDPRGEAASRGRSARILLSSPDTLFAGDVAERLRLAGHAVRVVPTAGDIVALAGQASPALLLLDQRTEDWDILRTDSNLKQIPMMLLVPAGMAYTDADTLRDFERGADGMHLCQESWRLFLAKVGAYLRRAGHDVSRRGVYRVGAVELDADIREVKVEGQRVQLSAKPFALLEALMRAPYKIFSRSELADLIWGPNFAVGEHTLDVHVHALRRELDRDPHRRCRLINIKNVGFKLKAAAPLTRPLVPPRVGHEVVPLTSTPIRRSLTADRCGKDRQEVSLSLGANQKAWLKKRARRRQTRHSGKAAVERYVHQAVSAG